MVFDSRIFRSILVAAASMLGAAAAPAPPSVTVTTVERQDVAPVYSFVGSVTPIQSVALVPRVTAFIAKEDVAQGAFVKAGDVIIELEPSQYQAALTQAQGQLETAQASQQNAQTVYDRDAPLAKSNDVPASQITTDIANLDEAKGNVLAAQANLAQAALNLSYCTIRAPIAGRIGVISPTPGNLVTPSTPAITTVIQMDPIRIVFSVSDETLVGVEEKLGSNLQKIESSVTVTAVLPTGTTYKQPGKIAFINNQVDPKTGTIAAYANFANPDGLLIPGSYVTVQLRSAQPDLQPLVPVAAVQTEQAGSYVLVVGADNKITQQPVTLGAQVAENYIVEKGLKGGERVVVEGVQKVRPGEVVNPQEVPESTQTASAVPG